MKSFIACVFYSHINLKVMKPDTIKKRSTHNSITFIRIPSLFFRTENPSLFLGPTVEKDHT